MTEESDIAAMFDAADGLGTVTAFVANAGIAAAQSRVDELTATRIAKILAVNVAGPLFGLRAGGTADVHSPRQRRRRHRPRRPG